MADNITPEEWYLGSVFVAFQTLKGATDAQAKAIIEETAEKYDRTPAEVLVRIGESKMIKDFLAAQRS